MQILKTKSFDRWAVSNKLSDGKLLEAAQEVKEGKVDAFLYGNLLIKKRIGIKGKGKRGGARTILTYKVGDRLIYIYGFEKNEKGNISKKEQEALKVFAKGLQKLTDNEVLKRIKKGELIKILND